MVAISVVRPTATMPITIVKPGLRAGEIDQRRAGAVPQAVGDQQRHHRTRQQRQRDAGGDKGEIGLKGHGELRRESVPVIMHGGAENSN